MGTMTMVKTLIVEPVFIHVLIAKLTTKHVLLVEQRNLESQPQTVDVHLVILITDQHVLHAYTPAKLVKVQKVMLPKEGVYPVLPLQP